MTGRERLDCQHPCTENSEKTHNVISVFSVLFHINLLEFVLGCPAFVNIADKYQLYNKSSPHLPRLLMADYAAGQVPFITISNRDSFIRMQDKRFLFDPEGNTWSRPNGRYISTALFPQKGRRCTYCKACVMGLCSDG